jgi:hypothetical protein
MCQNLLRHSHCPRIRWSRQLQGTQRGRLKLMEQSSEQVPLIRNIFGPGWCLTRVDDEFRQEGVDVQDATFSGKLADIPRSEVKSPHGNGPRHRNAMNGPRWYPDRTSWRNNPESLLRLYGHNALGGEDQLVRVVEVFRYAVLITELIRQRRQASCGMTFRIKQSILTYSRHRLSQ